MGLIKEALDNREFLKEFTLQQLRSRYRNSVLGYLWTLLVPLILFASLAFIFSVINHLDTRKFGPYFFGGYLPWLLFVNASLGATGAILGNGSLINRIKVPKSVFPVSILLVNLVDFGGFTAATLLIMVFVGADFSAAMLFLPIASAILILFVLGVCFLFATINVFVRDFFFAWASLSTLWFFCTPIIYPLSQVNPEHRKYFELNPILPFIQLFQDPISKGALPSMETIVISIIYAVILFVFGSAVFARSQKSFYAYL